MKRSKEKNEPGISEGVDDVERASTMSTASTLSTSSTSADLQESTAGEPVELEPLEVVHELEYAPTPKGKGTVSDPDDKVLELSSISEARAVLEAYLFASNEPLAVNRLARLMNNLQ